MADLQSVGNAILGGASGNAESAADRQPFERFVVIGYDVKIDRPEPKGRDLLSVPTASNARANSDLSVRDLQQDTSMTCSSPRVLFHYPPETELEHEMELKLFCMPFDRLHTSRIRRSRSLDELHKLMQKSEMPDANPEQFVIVLNLGKKLLYGVCLVNDELAGVMPSFVPHTPKPLAKDFFVVVKRCYCLLTHTPLFVTHFSVLQSLREQERIQMLQRIPLLLEHALVDEQQEGAHGTSLPIIEILRRYHSQFLPVPGAGTHRVVLSPSPVRFECVLKTGRDADLIAEWAIPVLFGSFSLEQVVTFYTAILLEWPVVVVSSNLGHLSACTLTVIPLLAPLVWQGPLITVLPASLREYLDSPVPLVAGVTSAEAVAQRDDIFVLDVDRGRIQPPSGLEELPKAKRLTKDLQRSFDAIKAILGGKRPAGSEENLPSLVEEAMLVVRKHTTWIIEEFVPDHYSKDAVLSLPGLTDAGRRSSSSAKSSGAFLRRFVASQQYNVFAEAAKFRVRESRYNLSVLSGNLAAGLLETRSQADAIKVEMEVLAARLAAMEEHGQVLEAAMEKVDTVLACDACSLAETMAAEDETRATLEELQGAGVVPEGDVEASFFVSGPHLTKEALLALLVCATQVATAANETITLEMGFVYYVQRGKVDVLVHGERSYSVLEGEFIGCLCGDVFLLDFVTHADGATVYGIEVDVILSELNSDTLMRCQWSVARNFARIMVAARPANASLPLPRKAEQKLAVAVRTEFEGQPMCAKLALTTRKTVGDLYKMCQTEFSDMLKKNQTVMLEHHATVPEEGSGEEQPPALVLSNFSQRLGTLARPKDGAFADTLCVWLSFVEPRKLVREVRCTWGNEGTLYLTPREAVHFSKLFGTQSRKNFAYKDTMLFFQQENVVLVSVRHGKPVRLVFATHTEASRVVKHMTALKGMDGSAPSRVLRRGTVLKPFVATKKGHLSLGAGLCVLQTDGRDVKIPKGWLSGICAGKSGIFPESHVLFTNVVRALGCSPRGGCSPLDDLPTSEDWARILAGGKIVHYNEGAVILEEGQAIDGLLQIISGRCVAQRAKWSPTSSSGSVSSSPGGTRGLTSSESDVTESEEEESEPEVTLLRRMGMDALLGEVSLLLGCKTTASIVAETETDVYLVSTFYLQHLFLKDPLLGAKFFAYLSTVLLARILRQN